VLTSLGKMKRHLPLLQGQMRRWFYSDSVEFISMADDE
jgi:hypothetical protein